MSENGKGDAPRPFSVDQETYKSNYDRIFAKKNDTRSNPKDEYFAVLKSGMFFELYPGLSGNWEDDQHRWETLKR